MLDSLDLKKILRLKQLANKEVNTNDVGNPAKEYFISYSYY